MEDRMVCTPSLVSQGPEMVFSGFLDPATGRRWIGYLSWGYAGQSDTSGVFGMGCHRRFVSPATVASDIFGFGRMLCHSDQCRCIGCYPFGIHRPEYTNLETRPLSRESIFDVFPEIDYGL
jgi:hypothetical protein